MQLRYRTISFYAECANAVVVVTNFDALVQNGNREGRDHNTERLSGSTTIADVMVALGASTSTYWAWTVKRGANEEQEMG